MIRSFVGALLWLLALWWAGAWLEALFGLPVQVGALAGVVVAGVFIGHGIRLATRSSAPAGSPAPSSETVRAN